jgi:hypothetical protein
VRAASDTGEVQRYDRQTLVFDSADSALGAVTLGLVALGLDPLYANDEDELVLLAREHRDRVAALVVPGTLPVERLDAVTQRVGELLPGGNAAVVVVAPPRQRALLGALRERGIRWVVFAPYDASELRFAVVAALASGAVLEPRSGLRVPIRLPATVCHTGCARSGEITNLSVGGAYLTLAEPPEPGAALSIEFPIGERMLSVQAVVAHRSDGVQPGPNGSPAGMGVAFSGLAPLEARLVEGFVRERIDSFRL